MSSVTTGQQRRLEEQPAALVRLAAEQHLGALRARVLDVRDDLVEPLAVDERADVHALLGADPDAQGGDRLRVALDERVVDAVLHEQAVGGDADLAGVAELAQDGAGDGLVEVGVVEDEERRVAAELERELHDLAGALRHQDLADGRRSREGELAHDRVARQLAADHGRVLGIAGHDLEDARGDPRAVGELGQGERRERRLLGRLAHDRVAGRERGRDLAGDHRRGEVPGRDAAADPDRLLEHDDPRVGRLGRDRVAVDALALLPHPLQESGGVADLGIRLGQRLTLLARHDHGEVAAVPEHQIGERAQICRALACGTRTPGRERRVGALDRPARLRGAHARHLGEHLAGRGIVHRERRAGVGRAPGAVDVAAVQAAIGVNIIARENVKALRDINVCEVLRRRHHTQEKLLEKQKAGKKRMKQVGTVENRRWPFLAILQVDDKNELRAIFCANRITGVDAAARAGSFSQRKAKAARLLADFDAVRNRARVDRHEPIYEQERSLEDGAVRQPAWLEYTASFFP